MSKSASLLSFISFFLVVASSFGDNDEDSPIKEIFRIAVRSYEDSGKQLKESELLPIAIAYAYTDAEAAKDLYERYLKIAPENARALRGYGATLADTDHHQAAIIHLKRAWDIGDLPAAKHLMRCYLTLSRYDEAYTLALDLVGRKYDDGDDIMKALLACAFHDPNINRAEELLTKTLEEVPMEFLGHDEELGRGAVLVLKKFDMIETSKLVESSMAKKNSSNR